MSENRPNQLGSPEQLEKAVDHIKMEESKWLSALDSENPIIQQKAKQVAPLLHVAQLLAQFDSDDFGMFPELRTYLGEIVTEGLDGYGFNIAVVTPGESPTQILERRLFKHAYLENDLDVKKRFRDYEEELKARWQHKFLESPRTLVDGLKGLHDTVIIQSELMDCQINNLHELRKREDSVRDLQAFWNELQGSKYLLDRASRVDMVLRVASDIADHEPTNDNSDYVLRKLKSLRSVYIKIDR